MFGRKLNFFKKELNLCAKIFNLRLKTYSSSFKANILDDFKSGILQKDLSIKYNVPKSTISRIVNNGNIYILTKGVKPRPKKKKRTRRSKN